MGKKRATLTDLLNDLTFRVIYDKFRLVCLNLFEWKNLPDGIEERHVENLLFEYGNAIFFRDPAMSYMCLKASPSANVNVNGDPLAWRAIGFNYNEEYAADNCVIIRNNKEMIATKDFILFYANKIAEAERTMDVNVKACKTPYIFSVDENSVLSFKAIFEKIDGNVPAIYTDKKINVKDIQVLQTGVPFLGDKLHDYKNSVESELLTFIGQNNTPIDKKERLITAEASSNDQLIQSFREIQLEARQKACEKINELYGLNISVDLRGVENSVESVENEEDEEVIENV